MTNTEIKIPTGQEPTYLERYLVLTAAIQMHVDKKLPCPCELLVQVKVIDKMLANSLPWWALNYN